MFYILKVTGEQESGGLTSTPPDPNKASSLFAPSESNQALVFFLFLDILRICLNLFHACPLEAGLTLMMGGRTAGGGSRVRPTVEGFARDPRVRASTRALGVMASKSWVFIRGPAGTATRAPGRRASGTALEWRAKAAGSTEGSGHRGSKVATGSWRARPVGPGTRGRGATGCRMVTALKPTLMEVRLLKLMFTVTSAPRAVPPTTSSDI